MVNKVTKSKMKKIFKKHPILSTICCFLSLLCFVHLLPLEHEFITGFKVNWDNYISYLYSVMLTTDIALIVYLFVDTETDDKLKKIKDTEKNIQKNTEQIGEITKMVQNDVNKMEENVQKISEIQNKIALETEKNRLINFAQHSSLPEENKRFFRSNIKSIFHESKYNFRQIDQDNNTLDYFTIIFIRKNNGLPKVFYPFGRVHEFPYFCVHVIDKKPSLENGDSGVQLDLHYYLSYDFSDKTWRIAEQYPIEGSHMNKSFKIIFSGTNYIGKGGPSAEEFCKNC